MPALNFQSQFADAVESGEKRQTIRATRKHPINHFSRLFLYTGMRTKNCRHLGTFWCQKVSDIEMWSFGSTLYVKIDGVELSREKTKELAIADGFKSAAEMLAWFEKTHGLPFKGQLIRW